MYLTAGHWWKYMLVLTVQNFTYPGLSDNWNFTPDVMYSPDQQLILCC